jgi:site-specific recombinase XerD
MRPQRGKRRDRAGKGRKGKKVRFVVVGPRAQRLIEDYLDAASKDVAYLTIKFKPEFARQRAGSSSKVINFGSKDVQKK